MRATGIVRRIDELGRIVIPKEIRRTMRIREMDSIEIYTAGDGEIVLKKFTPMGEMMTFAKEYSEALGKISGNAVCITDKENVLAACGSFRKELENSPVTGEYAAALERRATFVAAKNEYIPVTDGSRSRSVSEIICPIMANGDLLGGVVMMGNDEAARLTPSDKKMTELAAEFIGVMFRG